MLKDRKKFLGSIYFKWLPAPIETLNTCILHLPTLHRTYLTAILAIFETVLKVKVKFQESPKTKPVLDYSPYDLIIRDHITLENFWVAAARLCFTV